MDQVFSNREVALSIWVIAFLSWAFTKREVRDSAKGVIAAFCHPKILAAYTLMAGYVYLVVDILNDLGFWEDDQIKTTLMWFIFVGSIEVFKASSIEDDEHYFRSAIKSHFKLLAIFEFIVAFHSFSLLAELIIIPITTIAVVMLAYSELKDEYKPVETLMSGFLSIFGILLFIFGLYYITSDFGKFATLDTFMGFAIPVLLSILLLPFIFVFSIYVRYESILNMVNIYTDDKYLRLYAKVKGLMYFRRDRKNMRKWLAFSCMSDFESKRSIKESICYYNENKREMV